MGNKGTHWVAVYNDPEYKYAEYFDSYGMPPPTKVQSYLETSGKPILFSTMQIQRLGTNECGYLCIKYIQSRTTGIQPYNILYNKKLKIYS